MLVDKTYQPIAVLNVLYVQYKLNRMALARYNEILSAPDNPRMIDGQPAQVDRGALHLKKSPVPMDRDSFSIISHWKFLPERLSGLQVKAVPENPPASNSCWACFPPTGEAF